MKESEVRKFDIALIKHVKDEDIEIELEEYKGVGSRFAVGKVRLTIKHKPTGLVATVHEYRSQHLSKKAAIIKLDSLIEAFLREN